MTRAALVALILAACGGGTTTHPDAAGNAIDATPTIDGAAVDGSSASPISAPLRTWTWVDFPDSACDDGSPTGLGVYLNDATSNVIVYFEGGGACWDYQTCYVLNTAVHGPFGAAQFANLAPGLSAGLFDPTDAQNPFRDWSMVFVPYCTGDLHAGDAIVDYTDGTTTKTYHHVGHENALAFLARLIATFPAPGKLVVAGSSAGGGGALFNYPAFRAHWPSGPMYLLDDSLPLLEGASVPQAIRDGMFLSWRLGDITDATCGTICHDDLSQWMKLLAATYPGDRMALISSQQDMTIRAYFALSGPAFQTALEALVADVLAPTAHFRAFVFPGATHTTAADPSMFTSNGVELRTWMTQMVGDDPAWTSEP